MRDHDLDRIAAAVRDVADFPKPGILFKDISPLLGDAELFGLAVEAMSEGFEAGGGDRGVDKVVGIEARGFIFGVPIAQRLGAGFVPIRKAGKLPAATLAATYDLEYGNATIEVHADAFDPGDRVLVVDDVLATGGTAAATLQLVGRAGGQAVGAAFLIELGFLDGRRALPGTEITTVLRF